MQQLSRLPRRDTHWLKECEFLKSLIRSPVLILYGDKQIAFRKIGEYGNTLLVGLGSEAEPFRPLPSLFFSALRVSLIPNLQFVF